MITNAKLIGSNVDPDAYHRTDKKRGDRDYPLGRSSLMLFAECPHKWIKGYERKETESTDWGTMLDCALLTPDSFWDRYVKVPQTYKSEKGEEKPWNWNANVCKAWREEREPRICIKDEEFEQVDTARRALIDNGPVFDLLQCSLKQVHLVAEWHDKATGLVVPLKTLIDLVPSLDHKTYGHCLADFKTSFTASGNRWSKVAAEHNYHVQAALSLDIYENASGDGRDSWLNVVQENYSPWEVADPIPMLSQDFIAEGRKAYHSALRQYCQCLAGNKWPSYPTSNLVIDPFQIVDPPPWLAMQQMQRLPALKPEPELSEMPS